MGAALGEVCRAYGRFPHEVAELPPAEREFVVGEVGKRLEERNERDNQQQHNLNGI